MLSVPAPAKLNLTLEVLSRRPDGFHEIRSVIQTISLCDRINLKPGPDISFRSNLADWKAEKSLVSRTARLLKEVTGYGQGASIEVIKHIPLVSGLGGDSSNGAATLHGLNKLWGLGLSPPQLLDLAKQLGSDVPFFLTGGTALVAGRGEMVTPLPPLPHRWVVLIIPGVARLARKTEQLYASLKPTHYTDGQITEGLIKTLKAGGDFSSSGLFNTFENVAFTRFAELSTCREHIKKVGAGLIHLAGSGPALFTLLKEKKQAEDLHTRLKQQNLETYLSEIIDNTERVL
ncbi:MAG: 4-(cytidine 5'-diphospho)-2-C-methyl-D-erythritol kinase [Chloroflexota bacterium]